MGANFVLHNSRPQVILELSQRTFMEWGIIALGGVLVAYLLYCYVREWWANRRFERIRRESREHINPQPKQGAVIHDDSPPVSKNIYRVEIVEEGEGSWCGQIWNADNEMVYQARRSSEDLARSHAVAVLLRQFDNSATPVTKTRYLRSE
jgi:phosphate/sulfate permease